MWDSNWRGKARNGKERKGQSYFCTKTNRPEEYMDTPEKRQILGLWTGTEQ